jgi:hypothetical protein
MRARWTLNFLLLILVVGLGWAVQRDLRVAREASLLTGMDPVAIEGVELSRPGRDTVKLERVSGGGWRMTAPYRIPADADRVARLLQVVQAPVVRSFPAEGADLERLGLAPDPIRISLGGQTLRFGGTEPIDRLRYVAAGDLVHLTQDLYYHLLVAPAPDYVDPHPFAGLTLAGGELNGEALDPATLAVLPGVKAERVETLAGDLAGRILSVREQGGETQLRFLVSPDGLRWSRPDLRLTYLVASPPPALVDQEAAGVAADSGQDDARIALPSVPPGTLPERASGLVEGLAPTSTPEPAEGEVAGRPNRLEAGSGEAIVNPDAPVEMRVERLSPAGPIGSDQAEDSRDARQREIDDAVAASFGGPPVRSQAQIKREEAGVPADEDPIVSPEDAIGPPPAVKLRP